MAPDINCRARRAAITTNANLLSGAWLSTVMRSLPSKGFQNFACALAETTAKTTRSHRNRLHLVSSALHVVVDHQKIVLRVTLDFLLRPLHAPLDCLLRVLSSSAQTPLKFAPRRRQDKNGHRGRQFLLHLLGALHIDFQHQVQTLAPRLLQRTARSAIPMFTEDSSVFQKLTLAGPAVKFLFGNKIIPFSGAFRGPRRTRGAGYRKHRPRNIQHLRHQRGFSRTGWPGDNEHQRQMRLGYRHSTFCACSRSFSMSDFTSSAKVVIARPSDSTPGVLESKVLASRCISCKRKSNFLPASPAPASSLRNCSTWLRRRASSSVTSLRSASSAASCSSRAGSNCAPLSSSVNLVSSRRANAGRTRSASDSISSVCSAIRASSPCISQARVCPSDRRIVSKRPNACARHASNWAPSRSCVSSLCSSLVKPGAATTPGNRNSAIRSGSVFTPNCPRNSSTAFI